MRYWPVASLTTDRTFSIRTGLAASTVAPGNTAPDASLTTPVMAPCADAEDGSRRTTKTVKTDRTRASEDRRASLDIALLPTCRVYGNTCDAARLGLKVGHVKDSRRSFPVFPRPI